MHLRVVLLFVAVVIPASAAAQGASSDAFFHLHQAVGHLEAVANGRCSTAQLRAAEHLLEAQAFLADAPAELVALAVELEAIAAADAVPDTVMMQGLRMRVHDVGEFLGLHHDAAWIEEFFSC